MDEKQGASRRKNKNVKSRSFESKQNVQESVRLNASYDFANLYKTAAETTTILTKKYCEVDSTKNDININPKHRKDNLRDRRNGSKATTSTPINNNKISNSSASTPVKSIMKMNSTIEFDNTEDISSITSTESSKRKKRAKSVSFMLDENDEVSVKKSKSENATPDTSIAKKHKIRVQKAKGSILAELNKQTHENNRSSKSETEIKDDGNEPLGDLQKSILKKKKHRRPKLVPAGSEGPDQLVSINININKESSNEKKKNKKLKKDTSSPQQKEDKDNVSTTKNVNIESKKKKKLKHKTLSNASDTSKDEPTSKSRKIANKTDNVADELENLSIGDNAHTITNLLDEMTVVDKNKKKKNKTRSKLFQNKTKMDSEAPKDSLDIETKEKKYKDRWKARRLNKKPESRSNDLLNSIIVENLPLKLIFSYKELLPKHFGKFGIIKRIGVAEVYPTEEPKPVFTTTIYFYSDGAATSALEEDNTTFQGNRIRVSRPLAPTLTTLMVRCRTPLDEQAVSSAFLGCGRIRSIRKVDKSKKSMSSAFIEFDGPEAVERAINMASGIKIGGKKVYVAKFEIRRDKKEKNHDEETEETSTEL